MSLPHRDWHFPTSIRFGNGRVTELASAAQSLGMRRPMLVTDSGLASLPFITTARDLLARAGLGDTFYGDVAGNPAESHVTEGIGLYLAADCDGVIGIGGGSALDCAKSIALAARQQRPLFDFEDVGDNWTRADSEKIAPCIAVPTTAGTGSEVGRAAVILDQSTQTKRLLFHPKMLPALVISDPELTLGLPPNITAWTGVDAFVHALEAWCAPGYHPMADGIAMEAMRTVLRWLPVAVDDGANLEARGHMLVAASMGATAFQKGLGSIHSLSHVLGARYHLHHGLTNAIVMPYGLARNARFLDARMTDLCTALGLKGRSTQDLVEHLLAFLEHLEIPRKLAQLDTRFDLSAIAAEDIGAAAFADPSTSTNAGPIDAAELAALYRDAVQGDLNFGY
ncbi:MAG: iron-containing alcohol dehydrogenase [Pseudomonadota bacterium]